MKSGVHPSRQTNYHAEARELTTADLDVMHLPERYWSAKRELFPEGSRARGVLDELASGRIVSMVQTGHPSMLVFQGPVINGPMAAASVIAKIARAHKFTVFYLDSTAILRHFVDGKVTADEEQGYRERAHTTDVLILDSLGSGYMKNEFVLNETMALIKWRQDHMRVTVVTTHLETPALEAMVQPAFFEIMSQGRVSVRCQTLVQLSALEGASNGNA